MQHFRSLENHSKKYSGIQDFLDKSVDSEKALARRFLGSDAGYTCLKTFSDGNMKLEFDSSLEPYTPDTIYSISNYIDQVDLANLAHDSGYQDIENVQAFKRDMDIKRRSYHNAAAANLWKDIKPIISELGIIQALDDAEYPRGLCRSLVSLMLETKLGMTKS